MVGYVEWNSNLLGMVTVVVGEMLRTDSAEVGSL